MDTLVSVVIPVYNVEEYLGECLESVITQTYKALEIICIEDCSTDSSLQILEEYQRKDNRIRIIKTEKNVGAAQTRNIGIENVQGEYLYFLDADDYIKEDAIEILLSYALKYDTECVFFNSTLKKESTMMGDVKVAFNLPQYDCIPMNGRELLKLLYDNNAYTSSVWRQFWKCDFFQIYNVRFDDCQISCEDLVFTIQALLNGTRMMILNKSLHTYRRRPGSLVFSLTVRKVQDAFHTWYSLVQLLQKEQGDEKIKIILESFCESMLCSAKRFYELNRNSVYDYADATEGHLFKYIIKNNDILPSKIEPDILQKIKQYQYVVIYGTGRTAIDVVYALEQNNIQIDCAIVSEGANQDSVFMGYHVKNIAELKVDKDETIFVIAVGRSNRQAVIEQLKEKGFENYVDL